MNLDLQPTLHSELVTLRPLREGDYENLFAVARDPLIWQQHPSSDRYQPEVFKIFFAEAMESKGAFAIIDKQSRAIIGSTRFKRIDGAEDALEIGWSFLDRKYWGGKYNQSVKGLMLDYALQAARDVVFHIGKNNMRSQKAVEKIGGVLISSPDLQYLMSKNENSVTFLIDRSSWLEWKKAHAPGSA